MPPDETVKLLLAMSDGTSCYVAFTNIAQFYDFASSDSGMYAVTDASTGEGFFLNPTHIVQAYIP